MSDDKKPKPDPVALVALPTIPRTTTRDEVAALSRRFDMHAELDASELGAIKKKTDKQTWIISLVVAFVGAAATIAAALISH